MTLQVKWMMYWIIFALFTTVEAFTDMFLCWWVTTYIYTLINTIRFSEVCIFYMFKYVLSFSRAYHVVFPCCIFIAGFLSIMSWRWPLWCGCCPLTRRAPVFYTGNLFIPRFPQKKRWNPFPFVAFRCTEWNGFHYICWIGIILWLI